MKCFYIGVLLYLTIPACLAVAEINNNGLKQSINGVWRFSKGDIAGAHQSNFADSTWEIVNIPHTWNVDDVSDEQRGYYQGVGWYRKPLTISPSWQQKRIFIFFEGANQHTTVYVNGNLVGEHTGGYTAFCFDISAFTRFDGKNVIAVRVDNAGHADIPPLSADFTFYGGIYRDVYVLASEPVHFDKTHHASGGVYVRTPLVKKDEAEIDVSVRIRNHLKQNLTVTVTHTVRDRNSVVVAEYSQNTALKKEALTTISSRFKVKGAIALWSPDHPELYSIETTLKEKKSNKILDQHFAPIGFRYFHFDPVKEFFLNGKHYKLMGANRHQDFEGLGNALPDALHENDVKLIKEMGGNFIRISHYPQDPALLAACDRLGILVWEEIPVVNTIPQSNAFQQNCIVMMQEMIHQHFNHPSVIIWAYMNEPMLKLPYKKNETAKLAQYKLALLLPNYSPTKLALYWSIISAPTRLTIKEFQQKEFLPFYLMTMLLNRILI